MDEESFSLLGNDGQILRRFRIEQLGEAYVALGLVDVGVCGAIDKDIHLFRFSHYSYGVDVGDVQIDSVTTGDVGHVAEDEIVSAALGGISEFIAKLSVGSCHEYVHLTIRLCSDTAVFSFNSRASSSLAMAVILWQSEPVIEYKPSLRSLSAFFFAFSPK